MGEGCVGGSEAEPESCGITGYTNNQITVLMITRTSESKQILRFAHDDRVFLLMSSGISLFKDPPPVPLPYVALA